MENDPQKEISEMTVISENNPNDLSDSDGGGGSPVDIREKKKKKNQGGKP